MQSMLYVKSMHRYRMLMYLKPQSQWTELKKIDKSITTYLTQYMILKKDKKSARKPDLIDI